MEELLIAAVIIFVAGFIQGIVGFGSAMIAVSLLSVYLDIKLVIPLVALLSMIIVSIITFQLRNHFEYKKIHPLVIGSLVGIPLGAYFLKNMDGNIVRIILGILLTTYGIYQLVNKESRIAIKKSTGYVLGFFAGILGGAFNTNGPPAILYVVSQPWNPHQIKVTLNSYFFLCGILVIAFHAISGLTTLKVMQWFLILFPFLTIGTLLGSKLYNRLNPEKFRKLIFIFLLFMGMGLMLKEVV